MELVDELNDRIISGEGENGCTQVRDKTTFAGDTRYVYRFVKRAFDIVFSVFALLILFIPSIVLCILIRLESEGNPIYKQTRMKRTSSTGELQSFTMYKFRSMIKNSDQMLDALKGQNEADGPLFKIEDDPRMTRVGKFIRKHSIDEMPQFLNVLFGQMSVVGPRPPLPQEVEEYTERDLKRLDIKPGVTGYWQVRGRSDLLFKEMVELDLKYIEERSFMVDIKIILRTVGVVFTGNGAR